MKVFMQFFVLSVRLSVRLSAGLISCFLCAEISWARINPIQDISKLDKPQRETLIRVQTAKIVVADYDLILTDFPKFLDDCKLLNYEIADCHRHIDSWLIEQLGYMTRAQIEQSEVNEPVSVDAADTRHAYRPYGYGRAHVFEVSEKLIDVKGTGSLNPKQVSHGNGLLTTAESLKEYVYEKMIERIMISYFSNALNQSSSVTTVGTYAVLDWGFDVIHKDGTQSPAGAIIRQAHDRYGDPEDKRTYNFLPPESALQVENILRLYGVSSSGGLFPGLDIPDLQGTKNLDLLDFGTFFVADTFYYPITHIYDERYEIEPESDLFVQPVQQIRLPFEIWGHKGRYGCHSDAVLMGAKELSRFIKSNRDDPSQIQQKVSAFLSYFFDPVEKRWQAGFP